MRIAAASCAILLSAAANAQIATVTVSHNHPTGTVSPGEVVRLRVHSGTFFAGFARIGLSGDLLPSPAVGLSSNTASAFSGPLVNLGTPALGGVVGFDVVGEHTGPFLEFDWTAPAGFTGPVVFDYQPAAAAPTVRLYPSLTSPAFTAVTAQVTEATLTVIPGPGPLALLGLVAGSFRRNRR